MATPWIVALDRSGTLLWQRAFDSPIGNDLSLDAVERRTGGWLLGGRTEIGLGEPWVVGLRDDGRVETIAHLPDLSNIGILDLDETSSGVRLLQGSSSVLFSGLAGQGNMQLARLDLRAGRASLLPASILYAGPPPPCDADYVPRNHPAFCGSTRRPLMLVPMPHDRLTPCVRGLSLESPGTPSREPAVALALEANVVPQMPVSPNEAVSLEGVELDVSTLRFCLSSPDCMRAFAAP